MDLETFQALSLQQVAALVHEFGPKVCVFPINGTRRWYVLEHAHTEKTFGYSYLKVIQQRYLEIFKLIFDHGIHTLVLPSLGPDIVERGEAYMQVAVEGFSQLATHPDFLSFFETSQTSVYFYGDYKRQFADTPYAPLCDTFEALSARTRHHTQHRLFFGLFAQDATNMVAEFSVRFFQEHGRIPTKQEIVTAYYGDALEPVDIFIGFDKFAAFDMPLISTGNEDLYFTVAPSFYLNTHQLRAILYDHIYARHGKEDTYETLDQEDWETLRAFYYANLGNTQGIGMNIHRNIWLPRPQVQLPADFFKSIYRG